MSKTFHVVSVLDRSGSMGNISEEVIGSYNSFIDDQKTKAKDENLDIRASLVIFDNKVEKVYAKKKIQDVEKLTDETYFVRGMTALNDAIGKTITDFSDKKRVIMFIETDGWENASREFTSPQIKRMVEEKTAAGWEFNFVGSDLSQSQTTSMSQSFGILNAQAIKKSSEGYATRNASFATATAAFYSK